MSTDTITFDSTAVVPDVAARPDDFAPLTGGDYRTLVEQVQAPIFVVQDGRMRYANPMVTTVFGFTREELLHRDPRLLTAPEDRGELDRRAVLREKGLESDAEIYDIRCLCKDGHRVNVRVSGARVLFDGRPARIVTMHDVSELRRATTAAEQRSQLLAQTEAVALIGSSSLDVATSEVTQSEGMFRIFGEVPVPGCVDRDWLMHRVPADDAARVREQLVAMRPHAPCEFEHHIRHADGTLRTVLHRAVADADDAGRIVRVVAIVQDITAQRQTEERLRYLSHCDEATGLPNRAALLERLHTPGESASRALLLLQIAQYKLVAESFGQASGDTLLGAVAERIALEGPRHVTLSHLGGGEYALLFDQPAAEPMEAPEALILSVFGALARPFVVEGLEVQVSGSIGFDSSAAGVSLPQAEAADPAGVLLRQAEAALRLALDQGEHHSCIHRPEHRGRSAQRLSMEAGLRRALQRGEFHLLYQPQVDLRAGGVVGVEALLRWRDPVHGYISPADFIPLAETSGLIVPIGEWVLRTACEQAVAWLRAGLPPVRVSVNLSMRQLQQVDIAERIHAIVRETGLDPCHLGLEITESMLIGESEHVARVLHRLKALGIEISLDDFGTGYSNLNHLSQLPIDVVKIDRSLVHDVTAAPQDVSMTRAVIRLAHSLQMQVLAEGVETEGQLALLITNECDQMQGYFFSRPVSGEAVAELLREGKRLPPHLLGQAGRARTLLIVDDDDAMVLGLQRLLRHDGYTLVSAGSGEEGLARLAECEVDVIVSDQRMPGMSGVEFLRAAKALYPDTVRIVLSGDTELQSIADAINDGAIDKFLTKRWDDERLRNLIAEAFHQKGLADENRRLASAVQAAHLETARANERLHGMLAAQCDPGARDGSSLAVAREWLEGLPVPVPVQVQVQVQVPPGAVSAPAGPPR